MTQKELSLLFPPDLYREGLLLLVSPESFHKLEGKTIERSRLHMLVCDGILELELNGKAYEMRGPSLLDIMDTVTVRINRASPDLRGWGLVITFEVCQRVPEESPSRPVEPFAGTAVPSRLEPLTDGKRNS